jgi:hypothetical protein
MSGTAAGGSSALEAGRVTEKLITLGNRLVYYGNVTDRALTCAR